MRTITKLQTLLVLFLTTAMVCFMGCKDDDDDVPTPDGGGTVATYAISGTVMDASNNPMAGVSVALSGAQSLSATTGSDGTYSFDLKSTPGSYKIAFKSEGYADRSYDVDVKKIESGVGQYFLLNEQIIQILPILRKSIRRRSTIFPYRSRMLWEKLSLLPAFLLS